MSNVGGSYGIVLLSSSRGLFGSHGTNPNMTAAAAAAAAAGLYVDPSIHLADCNCNQDPPHPSPGLFYLTGCLRLRHD